MCTVLCTRVEMWLHIIVESWFYSCAVLIRGLWKTVGRFSFSINSSVVFWCWKYRQNSNRVTTNGGAKCRCSRLNAGAVAENRRLSMRSVASLAQSQVYHTERPPHVCSTLAMMQRVALVCQRQMILVIMRPTCNAGPSTCRLTCYCSCCDVIIPKFQTEFRFFLSKTKTNQFRTDSVVFAGKPNAIN